MIEERLMKDGRRLWLLFDNFINEMREQPARSGSSAILSCYISTFTKGGNLFFKELNRKFPQTRFVALSQSGRVETKRRIREIEMPVLALPITSFMGAYTPNEDATLLSEEMQLVKTKSYLHDAVCNIKAFRNDMGNNYAEALVYNHYRCAIALLDHFLPAFVIVHNVLYPGNDILRCVAEEKGILTLYFEFGSLPGTFSLEHQGQMGRSWTATRFREFLDLPVAHDELIQAEAVIDFLNTSGLNRNKQTQKDLSSLFQRMNRDRPVIFFAGENTYDSGLCPYTEASQLYHSPVFQSGDEAVTFLAELALTCNWNLLYKPHPSLVKHKCISAKNMPKNVIIVTDVDINDLIDHSDLTVTILSQCAYISLIRGKATLLLGYTQLKGKGCTYEAFDKESIKDAIEAAFYQGFSKTQQTAFVKHVAQCIKYYLYDDLCNRPLRFGRSVDECGRYIKELLQKRMPVTSSEIEMPKYVFLETDYFSKRIVSNEIDLLDELAVVVGKENVLVKLYSEESSKRFEMRGYKCKTFQDDEWQQFCLNVHETWFLGLEPENYVDGLASAINDFLMVSFRKLYIGPKGVITSTLAQDFENFVYVPRDLDTFRNLLAYLAKGVLRECSADLRHTPSV
jgi:hypothetical protein